MAKFNIKLGTSHVLKIGAHQIPVKFVSGGHESLSEGSCHGSWIPREYTIYVNKDDPESLQLSTLFHEIIHVFEYFYEIKISHKDLNLVGDMFAQVFLDNFALEQKKRK